MTQTDSTTIVQPASTVDNKSTNKTPKAETAIESSSTNTTFEHSHSISDSVVHFWHQHYVHWFLIGLLAIDILLIIASIALEIEFLNSKVDAYEFAIANPKMETPSKFGNYTLKKWKLDLGYTSVAIVCVFLLENISLLLALRGHFIKDFTRMMDLVVCVVSIWLELYFLDQPEGGLLILARSWRFVRIGHGIYDTQKLVAEEEMKKNIHGAKNEILEAYNTLKDLHLYNGHIDSDAARNTVDQIQELNPHVLLQVLAATGEYLENQHNPMGGKQVKKYPLRSEQSAGCLRPTLSRTLSRSSSIARPTHNNCNPVSPGTCIAASTGNAERTSMEGKV